MRGQSDVERQVIPQSGKDKQEPYLPFLLQMFLRAKSRRKVFYLLFIYSLNNSPEQRMLVKFKRSYLGF